MTPRHYSIDCCFLATSFNLREDLRACKLKVSIPSECDAKCRAMMKANIGAKPAIMHEYAGKKKSCSASISFFSFFFLGNASMSWSTRRSTYSDSFAHFVDQSVDLRTVDISTLINVYIKLTVWSTLINLENFTILALTRHFNLISDKHH